VCNGGACASATCNDGVKNGTESGVDCGGLCAGCVGTPCSEGPQCAPMVCTAGLCAAPSCSDGLLNGNETAVDCGGSCPGCPVGQACDLDGDCQTGFCSGGVCAVRLVISEIRTRGLGGGADEFVEIYNPNNAPVTLDATWNLAARTAQGVCTQAPANAPVLLFTFGNQMIPAHRHFLMAGASYAQAPAKDASLSSAIVDSASVMLRHGAVVVDAVCFYFDQATQQNLQGCAIPYVCEGTPISNQPHDGSSTASSTVDVSFERKPGGAAGNGADSGDNAADFTLMVSPANPQNLNSAAVP
jgi:hypothetical protein